MRKILSFLFIWLFAQVSVADGGVCQGKFFNPITDICWSCIFPISLGGKGINAMGQEDTDNPKRALCACSNPPMVGISMGFWEPVRLVDVTRAPYCLVSLGGIKLDPGIKAPEGEVRQQADLTKQSFWQAHWYTNPLMFWLKVLLDDQCLEEGSLDVAYLTEVDPLWNDDELTLLLHPEGFLFGGPLAQAVCAADCVASTAGFGMNTLFWCAGCNGSIYPMNGRVQAHVSNIQASALVVQRMAAKLHRELLIWSASGDDGMCGYYPQPIMDKTNYKFHMVYPVAQTKKDNQGRCCQPLGRSTLGYGAGKQIPYLEHYSYQLFRKRNCCQGTGGVMMDKHLAIFCLTVCLFSPICYAQETILAFPDDASIDAEMRRVEMQRKKLFEQESLKNPPPMQAPDVPIQVLQQQQLDVLDIAKQYVQKEPQAKSIQAQGLMVFASFSIPDASLKQLAKQTERAGGVMIFRGFKQGSLKETLRAIEQLEIAHTSFQIHPAAFTQYKVNVVPTVVLAKIEASKQLDSDGCALPDTYASVSGDTSLDFALEAISRHEKQFAPVALPYIEKLRWAE